MKYRLLAAALPASLIAGIFWVTLPQTSAQSSLSTPPTPKIRTSSDPVTTSRLFSIRFEGGTVEKYLEVLRSANQGQPPNVACSQEVMHSNMGPVQLESVNMFTALNAIGAASTDPRAEWAVQPLDQGQPLDAGAIQAYRILLRRHEVQFGGPGWGVKTFALRDYVGNGDTKELVKKAATLISAVEATLEKNEDVNERTWSVKFHPESALLIIRGSNDDLSAAAQVVSQLVGESHDQMRVAENRKEMQQERERNMAVARDLLKAAEDERARASDRARAITREFEASGDAKLKAEIEAANMAYQEAASKYDFRTEQFRRIEEQNLFGRNVTSPSPNPLGGPDQAEAKIRELQSTVDALKAQIMELQARLKASGSRPK